MQKASAILKAGILSLWRDWRAGELHLLALALMIAVAAMASVGLLTDSVSRAVQHDASQMLGGDLVLRSDDAWDSNWLDHARELGLQVASAAEFPSMAASDDGMQLVSVKAVTDNYPLRGALHIKTAVDRVDTDVRSGPVAGTAWVEARVLSALGLQLGDSLELGAAVFRIMGEIAYEPDRGMQFVSVAPRVMINQADLAETGLEGPGSRIRYQLMVAGPEPAVRSFRSWVQPKLKRGQAVRTLEESQPAMQRALARAQQFLGLVVSLTVMVAAVAIAMAARHYRRRHQAGVAVMRTLGASRQRLAGTLMVEFALLGIIASALGGLLGWACHQVLAHIVADLLTTQLPSPRFTVMLQAGAAGLLLLLAFAWPPLVGLSRVAPAQVLRDAAMPAPLSPLGSLLPGLLVLAALIVWMAGDLRIAATVGGGMVVALLAFAVLAAGVLALLSGLRRHWRPTWSPLRLALDGLTRRRTLTLTQACALGLGLAMLLLLGITRNDLLDGWRSSVPPDAPNTFLINIQPEQRLPVVQRLESLGLQEVQTFPMLRGRLDRINDRPVQVDDYDDARARRMVDREFNLSYADRLPAANQVAAGRWLSPENLEASVEVSLADTLQIAVGDRLTFDVAGQPVEVTVTGLREVDWDSMQANFFVLLSPAALADAPKTFMTAVHVPEGQASGLQALLHDYPNLTLFDVGAILQQVQGVLSQVIQAVQLLFIFTLAAGVLVLAAALHSTRDERIHEMAVLRILGAGKRQLSAAMWVELGLTGALAGGLAAFAAQGVAALLAKFVFEFPLGMIGWPWPIGMAAGACAAMLAGWYALEGVLRSAPMQTLRKLI